MFGRHQSGVIVGYSDTLYGYTGAAMRFERGNMLWTDERLIYVLSDDGNWTVAQDTF